MIQKHLIIPLEEVIDEWESEWWLHQGEDPYVVFMAKQAAQWGADQELEACCEWMSMHTTWDADRLRIARRPKALSLKDEVKQIIDCLVEGDCLNDEDETTLRRALEQLND